MNARPPTEIAGWTPNRRAPQRVPREVGGQTVPAGGPARSHGGLKKQRDTISGRCAAFGALPRLSRAGVKERSAGEIDRDPWPHRRRAPSSMTVLGSAVHPITSPRRLPVEFLPPPPGAWGRLRLKNQGGPRIEPAAVRPQPQERRFSIGPRDLLCRIVGKPALRPTITPRS